MGELGAGLVEDVAGLDVGEEQAVGVTGNLAGELLGLGALLVDGAVEAQRTVDDGTGNLATLISKFIMACFCLKSGAGMIAMSEQMSSLW